jgi:hypothetical protein
VPIIYDVFDASDPFTKIGTLSPADHGAREKKFKVVNNGYGDGEFVINRHDAAYIELNQGLTRHDLEEAGQLVKVKLTATGPYIFAWWIENGQDQVLSPKESGGEDYKRAGRGVMSYIERAVVYPELHGAAGTFADDMIIFTNETYGTMLATLLDEALLRDPSPIEFLTYDFTGSVDSNGTSWPAGDGRYEFEVGMSYDEVVSKLQALGVHVKMTPDLVLQARMTYGVDRTATHIYEKGVNIRETASREVHGNPIRTRLLVQGANEEGNTIYEEVISAAWEALPRIGRREGFFDYGTTPNRSNLRLAGATIINNLVGQREGAVTIGVKVGEGEPEPFSDYDEGDTVHITVPGEYEEDRVIRAIFVNERPAGAATDLDFDPGYDAALEFHSVPYNPDAGGVGGCCDPPPPFTCIPGPDACDFGGQLTGNGTFLAYDLTAPAFSVAMLWSGCVDAGNSVTFACTNTVIIGGGGTQYKTLQVVHRAAGSGDPWTAAALTPTNASHAQGFLYHEFTQFGGPEADDTGTFAAGGTDQEVAVFVVAGNRYDNPNSTGFARFTGDMVVSGANAASATTCPAPSPGQPVRNEVETGDGSTTDFTTDHPYRVGSLEVHVNGVLWDVNEDDPAAGDYSHDYAPPNDSEIRREYQGVGA